MRYLNEYGAQLVALGYPIIPLPPAAKGPRKPGWQNIAATPELLAGWLANGSANDGVGILAAHTPAIDVDILDAPIAEEVRRLMERHFGPGLHTRIGMAPKFLVPFRCDDTFKKLSSNHYYDPLTDVSHHLEILAEGQQWVAFNEHPDTHQPYAWPRGSLTDTPHADLPLLTHATATAFIADFERIAARLVAQGQWELKTRAEAPAAKPDLDPLLSWKPTLDFATLKAALTKIPNAGQNELDYDDWRNVIFAIHRETGGQDHGLRLAHAWSARSSKYSADFIDNHVWPYIRSDRPDAVTGLTILKMAKQYDTPLKASPPQTGYIFKPGSDFMTGFEDVAYRVDGLLPDVGVAMVYGMSGAAKTFAVLDLAFCVHRGTPWLSNTTTAAPVFYIASEASRGIRKRIAAYVQRYPGAIPFFADRAPDLMNTGDVDEIALAIESHGGAGMLIVDTLATSHSGDENSAQDMGRVIQHATYLSLRLNCLVIVVHHSRKDGLDFRGSYALRANVDAVAEITAEGEHPNRTHRIVFHKTRDDDDGTQLGFRLVKSEPLGHTATGRVIDSCTIEEIELTRKKEPNKRKPNADMSLMLEVYEEISCLAAPTTVIELIEAVRAKEPKKRDFNLRRSLKDWIGFEGNRLPDELVLNL